jgi:hypothetical protein
MIGCDWGWDILLLFPLEKVCCYHNKTFYIPQQKYIPSLGMNISSLGTNIPCHGIFVPRLEI